MWEPRIQAISRAWQQVELLSVEKGLRRCALVTLPYERCSLPRVGQIPNSAAIVLAEVPLSAGYQSASRPLVPGESRGQREVIAQRADDATAFAAAYRSGDNRKQAELLGYPACCIHFFEQVWKKERWMDTTWPMFRTLTTELLPNGIKYTGNVNMLWRYLGIRPVFHLPCSPVCAESHKIAIKLRELLPIEERGWMAEILSWPVEWTALHGIGELRTPITRTSFATDATAEKLTIQWEGEGAYPEEGAKGTKFPHRQVFEEKGIPLTFTRRPGTSRLGVGFGDNGFSSYATMQAAHKVIIDFVRQRGFWNVAPEIVDLGCGNGLLVSQLPGVNHCGVENRDLPHVPGVQVNRETIENFLAHEVGRADLYLIALERFEEAGNGVGILSLKGRTVLVYSYAPDHFFNRLDCVGLSRSPIRGSVVNSACTLALFDPL